MWVTHSIHIRSVHSIATHRIVEYPAYYHILWMHYRRYDFNETHCITSLLHLMFAFNIQMYGLGYQKIVSYLGFDEQFLCFATIS